MRGRVGQAVTMPRRNEILGNLGIEDKAEPGRAEDVLKYCKMG